jgi:hypothetical protein
MEKKVTQIESLRPDSCWLIPVKWMMGDHQHAITNENAHCIIPNAH